MFFHAFCAHGMAALCPRNAAYNASACQFALIAQFPQPRVLLRLSPVLFAASVAHDVPSVRISPASAAQSL
jgi:hypothetical protein